MRYLSTILLTVVLTVSFACGGSSKKTAEPELSAIPWENITNPAERAYYEITANCPEATNIVQAVLTWPLVEFDDGTENPQQTGDNRFIALRSAGSAMALIQFRTNDIGKVIVEGVLVAVGEIEFIVLDYHVVKGLREGTLSEDMENSKLYKDATGEFFCGYLGN